ncbi:MAG: type II toxin-antitoxin system VapC family toxin [bacterium]|nr:type II toxin-antitoxin system VapC family toxin [bacterium]MCY3962261.1 type II toxin-antitoxin system VapC family toxin [bacterium]MCY4135845.1 type II toxin-antitoxin system VapC family toxin [bacterium]
MSDLLLDTHALLWCWLDDPLLSPSVREVVTDPENDVFISAASAWEIATKFRLGRLPEYEGAVLRFNEFAIDASMRHLPVTYQHGLRAGSYPAEHRDPFDRILAAQAELESLVLVTKDAAFQEFPIRVLW